MCVFSAQGGHCYTGYGDKHTKTHTHTQTAITMLNHSRSLVNVSYKLLLTYYKDISHWDLTI